MDSYLKIFEPILKDMNLEIVSYNRLGDLIELIIAYEGSLEHVDLDTCAKAAQALAEAIDYDIGLDVSSQGAERVIDSDMYDTVIGSYIYVKFKNPKAGMDEVQGVLESVDDEVVCVKYRFKHTHKTVDVERNNIELLRLAVEI